MMRPILLLSAFSTVAFCGSAQARSQPLQCNPEQTRCIASEAADLTVGDRVGVFNNEGELVASGRVKAMRGDRRSVTINKRHGKILRDHRLALLANDKLSSDLGAVSSYKVYREPAELSVGGSFGLASVPIGEGSQAYEMSGYAQWKWTQGWKLVARGVYTAIESEVTRYGSTIEGADVRSLSVTTFAALGGIAHVARENQSWGYRGELSLGPMMVDAKVDGDKGLSDDGGFRTHVENGFGLLGRASAGVQWNLDDWHAHGDFVLSQFQNVTSYALAIGLSKDLP